MRRPFGRRSGWVNDMRSTSLFGAFLQDVHYGVRSLMRSPLLAGAVVLTLALGIGLNTAVFTVINGSFFRARVEKDPVSFVQLVSEYSGKFEQPRGLVFSTSLEDFRAYQAHARSVSNLAGWNNVRATIGDDPNEIMPLLVTCNFFSLYGLEHAKLGRPERASLLNDSRPVPGANRPTVERTVMFNLMGVM